MRHVPEHLHTFTDHRRLISPQGSVNFKFGVLYAKDGQLTDDEMFSNGRCLTFELLVLFKKKMLSSKLPLKTGVAAQRGSRAPTWLKRGTASLSETGSESFEKFLSLLGDSITLQGWAGYRGGLDTKSE